MTETEALRVCDIIFHIEVIRDALRDAGPEEFDNDETMQDIAFSRLSKINDAIDEIGEEALASAHVELWDETRNIRNKVTHTHESVTSEEFYGVLTETLAEIETALRVRIAASIFDCEELHGRLGKPKLGRDIGTDREKKGRRGRR